MKNNNANRMILDDMKAKILRGEYPVGSKLPSERELSEYYNVSRIPVREALKALSDMGILEIKRGAGTFVKSTANAMQNGEKEQTETFMQPDVILLETIHVRKLLESEAAAQAAKNIRKDEIDDLEKALITTIQEIWKLKTGQDNDFFQADAKFHRLILRASHNPVFEQCLEAMPNIMSLHQYWSLKMTTPMDEVVTYHCSIFENILIHNEAGAREAMMAHLSRVEELLARKVPEEKEGESPVPKVWYTT